MHTRAPVWLVAPALVVVAATAFADEKLACVAAADAAQQQRSAGKLRQARASLHICAREVCPAIVKSDCTQWLAEVEASVPTIVLRAQDPRGQDLSDVKVQLDGVLIADKIDGLPIEIDPGQHVLTCEHAGSKKLRQDIVVRTGDRNRTISLVLEDVEPILPVIVPPPSNAPTRARISPAAWLFSGLAVAAGATGTYFGVRSISDKDHLKKTCAPFCSSNDVDAVRTREDVATATIGVAIASAGLAAYFFLNPSRVPVTALPEREVLVVPLFGGGAAASWIERF